LKFTDAISAAQPATGKSASVMASSFYFIVLFFPNVGAMVQRGKAQN